jgi:hypothetical protein
MAAKRGTDEMDISGQDLQDSELRTRFPAASEEQLLSQQG